MSSKRHPLKGGVKVQDAGGAQSQKQCRADSHTTAGERDRRQVGVDTGRENKVGGEADRGTQAPGDAERVETSSAGEVENECQSRDGGGGASHREWPGPL